MANSWITVLKNESLNNDLTISLPVSFKSVNLLFDQFEVVIFTLILNQDTNNN